MAGCFSHLFPVTPRPYRLLSFLLWEMPLNHLYVFYEFGAFQRQYEIARFLRVCKLALFSFIMQGTRKGKTVLNWSAFGSILKLLLPLLIRFRFLNIRQATVTEKGFKKLSCCSRGWNVSGGEWATPIFNGNKQQQNVLVGLELILERLQILGELLYVFLSKHIASLSTLNCAQDWDGGTDGAYPCRDWTRGMHFWIKPL